MEANTVVISLEKYHELMAYKEAMELEKSIYIHYNHGHSARVISNDEAVKLIGEINEELKKEIDGFSKKVIEARHELNKIHSTFTSDVDKIRRMSLCQLIKWYFNGKEL